MWQAYHQWHADHFPTLEGLPLPPHPFLSCRPCSLPRGSARHTPTCPHESIMMLTLTTGIPLLCMNRGRWSHEEAARQARDPSSRRVLCDPKPAALAQLFGSAWTHGIPISFREVGLAHPPSSRWRYRVFSWQNIMVWNKHLTRC